MNDTKKITLLPMGEPSDIRQSSNSPRVTATVKDIITQINQGGDQAALELREQLDGIAQSKPLVLDRETMRDALDSITSQDLGVIERTAARVRRFAEAQLASVSSCRVPIEGGVAGHELVPIGVAGCYAPGGRYPLISSMLMSVIPAKVAGVEFVVAASPSTSPFMTAASYVAGADRLLLMGGAQAIATMAQGACGLPAAAKIVGPGNAYVTEAKAQLFGQIGIDMLAGPSELVVLADANANAKTIALDLIAQAEHAPDAQVNLVTDSANLVDEVRLALEEELSDLSTASTAITSLSGGRSILVANLDEGIATVNRLASEHLALHVDNASDVAPRVKNAGAIFIGEKSAEVFCDYGAGPNHTLPTSGGARYSAGLSVMDFLRFRTFLDLEDPEPLIEDVTQLARLEGLEGHARAAECRRRFV